MAHYNYFYTAPAPWPPYQIDPYRTTVVPHHFPEHHYPLEHTRHSLTRAVTQLGHAITHPFEDGSTPPTFCPRADIQESEGCYYIDVELPGIEGSDKIKLNWLTASNLLVQTRIERGKVETTVDQEQSADGGPLERVRTHEEGEAKNGMYLTLKERQVGLVARAFHFPTEVDPAGLEARLHHGLLRLKVPKVVKALVNEEHRTPVVQEIRPGEEKAKI